jgi:hypothetical protein
LWGVYDCEDTGPCWGCAEAVLKWEEWGVEFDKKEKDGVKKGYTLASLQLYFRYCPSKRCPLQTVSSLKVIAFTQEEQPSAN